MAKSATSLCLNFKSLCCNNFSVSLNLCFHVLGIDDPANYPEYVLAIHSSKRLLVEQISPPAYVLADAIISLTLTKGQRHEVGISF